MLSRIKECSLRGGGVMNNDHQYFRNRRQYRLDKLWDKIKETEKRSTQEETNRKGEL